MRSESVPCVKGGLYIPVELLSMAVPVPALTAEPQVAGVTGTVVDAVPLAERVLDEAELTAEPTAPWITNGP